MNFLVRALMVLSLFTCVAYSFENQNAQKMVHAVQRINNDEEYVWLQKQVEELTGDERQELYRYLIFAATHKVSAEKDYVLDLVRATENGCNVVATSLFILSMLAIMKIFLQKKYPLQLFSLDAQQNIFNIMQGGKDPDNILPDIVQGIFSERHYMQRLQERFINDRCGGHTLHSAAILLFSYGFVITDWDAVAYVIKSAESSFRQYLTGAQQAQRIERLDALIALMQKQS